MIASSSATIITIIIIFIIIIIIIIIGVNYSMANSNAYLGTLSFN